MVHSIPKDNSGDPQGKSINSQVDTKWVVYNRFEKPKILALFDWALVFLLAPQSKVLESAYISIQRSGTVTYR